MKNPNHTCARVLLVGLLLAASTLSACYRDPTMIRVGGNALEPSPFLVMQIQPAQLVIQTLPVFGCPGLPPFATAFELVFLAPEIDLRLDSVTLRLVDGLGISGTPIPFLQPDLSRLFPQPFVTARTTRSFPFSFQFGCFPQVPVLLTSDVTLVTSTGMPIKTTASAAIAYSSSNR